SRVPPRPTIFPYTTLFRSRQLHTKMEGRRDSRSEVRFGNSLISEDLEDLIDGASRHAMAIGHGNNAIEPAILLGSGFIVRRGTRSEEHTSELQSRRDLVCR